MMRSSLRWLLSLALLSAGCELFLGVDPSLLQEDSPTNCSDGIDNDEDGLSDCQDANCADFCNKCGNGVVDIDTESCDDGNAIDGDGCTACMLDANFGCEGQPSACVRLDAVCATLPLVNTGTFQSDSTNGTALFKGSCQQALAKNEGFAFVPPGNQDGELVLTLSSATDQVVYVRASCEDNNTELRCTDQQGGGTDEVLQKSLDGSPITIFVGAFAPGLESPYTLTVEFTPSVCGDSQITGIEACDDGNTADGDGCSSACRIETAFTCFGLPSQCQGLATTCAATQALDPSLVQAGDSSNGSPFLRGFCQGDGARSLGFSFTPTTDGPITLKLSSATNQAMFVRSACDDLGSEGGFGCEDKQPGGIDEELKINGFAGVPLFFGVGGVVSGDEGPFTLTVLAP